MISEAQNVTDNLNSELIPGWYFNKFPALEIR